MSVEPSVYQRLLMLHQPPNPEVKQASLEALPDSFRQKIFDGIDEQSENPSEPDERLQRAVAKVASETFKSLKQTEKDTVAKKMREHTGEPKEDNWAEIHATEDVPILLKIMHDALGDLTPELQNSLDQWVNEADAGENRAEARSKIIDFLKDRKKERLNLSGLGLKSLPPIFDAKPFVSRLKSLDLSSNEITSIPEPICQLQNLRILNLESNQISLIPDQIGQLQNLRVLDLNFNNISLISEQIGRLENLERLYLFDNQLSSIPEQIGELEKLEILSLNNNQLAWIPEQIGLLQKLRHLYLQGNFTLQGLPNEIVHLNPTCEVDVANTGLSERVRSSLQEICNAPGYRGPTIFYSMAQPRYDGELTPLPDLIKELYVILEEEPKEFSGLEKLDIAQKKSLQSWLSRLSDTADYKRKGQFQKDFVKKIVTYLKKANEDAKFREVFLNIISGAADTCGDRVALSILHLGVDFHLRQIDQISELKDFLIKTVWPLDMLENIARSKVKTLKFVDQIEVFLGYPIMLKEKLGLDVAVEEMLYFRCSSLKESDLAIAAEFVIQQQNEDSAVCAYLASRSDWIDALRANFPDECAKIDAENAQEEKEADDDGEKLEQYVINKKQRWEALTARYNRGEL